jgi:hypothetical protein
MIINLKQSKYYFLNNNNEIRKNHILEEFKDYNITAVSSDTNYNNSRNKSGASGFYKILELGKDLQDESKNFESFIILEDDIKKYREFPEFIEIPDNTDILYIGLSKCGIFKEGVFKVVQCSNVNIDIIKIYNMLSSHGIIICSPTGLSIMQKSMLESITYDLPWDIDLALSQININVYALRIPLVYQYEKLGGNETSTKIEYNIYLDIPPEKKIKFFWLS